MILGLSHITFIVKDLQRASLFWRQIFDAQEVYDSGGQYFSLAREKFLTVGGIWICLMAGDPREERSYDHIAFQIAEEALEAYLSRIRQAGADIKEARRRLAGEGRSVYFYDFDGHLFELHTGALAQRLECYRQYCLPGQ